LHGFFPPSQVFYKYFIPEVLPALLMGLALPSGGSIMELAGTGHRGSLWQLFTEATSASLHYQNLATQTHYVPSQGKLFPDALEKPPVFQCLPKLLGRTLR